MTEPARRGAGVVVALAGVLVLLLAIWAVGTFLLLRYADDLPKAPTETPSPTVTR